MAEQKGSRRPLVPEWAALLRGNLHYAKQLIVDAYADPFRECRQCGHCNPHSGENFRSWTEPDLCSACSPHLYVLQHAPDGLFYAAAQPRRAEDVPPVRTGPLAESWFTHDRAEAHELAARLGGAPDWRVRWAQSKGFPWPQH